MSHSKLCLEFICLVPDVIKCLLYCRLLLWWYNSK